MALSTVVNSIGSAIGHSNITEDPVKPSLPQICDSLESERGKIAVRLPNMDERQPLEINAKDLTTVSDSDQQQQSNLNSSFAFSSTSAHTLTKANLSPSQQSQDVMKSFESSSSAGPRGRGGNQGIKAARHRFLLEKAAKQQEAKAASEDLKLGDEASEMSPKPSAPTFNRWGASISATSIISTSQTSTQQVAVPKSMVLLPSNASYPQNQTSSSTVTNDFYNHSSSHRRPNSAFHHSVPQHLNDYSYLSSAGQDRRVQNGWANREHLYVKVCGLPAITTTRDLWAAFKHEGHIAHIRLYENAKGHRDGGAMVKFRYAPEFASCSSDYDY